MRTLLGRGRSSRLTAQLILLFGEKFTQEEESNLRKSLPHLTFQTPFTCSPSSLHFFVFVTLCSAWTGPTHRSHGSQIDLLATSFSVCLLFCVACKSLGKSQRFVYLRSRCCLALDFFSNPFNLDLNHIYSLKSNCFHTTEVALLLIYLLGLEFSTNQGYTWSLHCLAEFFLSTLNVLPSQLMYLLSSVVN